MPMESYHMVWLASHPNRTLEWLQERMRDGFDVHHLDGDHGNDAEENLVLIECLDHMRLHGRSWNRLVRNPLRKRSLRQKPRVAGDARGKVSIGLGHRNLNTVRFPVPAKGRNLMSCKACGASVKAKWYARPGPGQCFCRMVTDRPPPHVDAFGEKCTVEPREGFVFTR